MAVVQRRITALVHVGATAGPFAGRVIPFEGALVAGFTGAGRRALGVVGTGHYGAFAYAVVGVIFGVGSTRAVRPIPVEILAPLTTSFACILGPSIGARRGRVRIRAHNRVAGIPQFAFTAIRVRRQAAAGGSRRGVNAIAVCGALVGGLIHIALVDVPTCISIACRYPIEVRACGPFGEAAASESPVSALIKVYAGVRLANTFNAGDYILATSGIATTT